MEYCSHGDLHHYLSHNTPLPVVEAQELAHQILEGLHDMHENGFAHRDLKPAVRNSYLYTPTWASLTNDAEYSHQIASARHMVGEARRFWYQ